MENVDNIVVKEDLFQQLVEHAINCLPNESVSIIAGHIKDNIAYAELVYTPENIDKSTVTFTVDPLVLLDIYNSVEEKGKTVIGIFHTHPAPPSPSSIDKSYMEVNPYVWLISSTNDIENPSGFILKSNGELKEVEVSII
ncbi:MAG: M67 family metallopeptidase [Asgard group archaeon]|nr:M67 family metallopeptidase [Asgard group archaeon]